MEFFIPGMLLFLLFLFLAFYFVPKATPMIAAILSIAFLIYGVRDHSQRFASEYRLSTWQEGLKMYAPAVMILVIIVFVIYSIFGLSLFLTDNCFNISNSNFSRILFSTIVNSLSTGL